MEAPDTGNAGVTMLAGVRSAVSSLKAYPGLKRKETEIYPVWRDDSKEKRARTVSPIVAAPLPSPSGGSTQTPVQLKAMSHDIGRSSPLPHLAFGDPELLKRQLQQMALMQHHNEISVHAPVRQQSMSAVPPEGIRLPKGSALSLDPSVSGRCSSPQQQDSMAGRAGGMEGPSYSQSSSGFLVQQPSSKLWMEAVPMRTGTKASTSYRVYSNAFMEGRRANGAPGAAYARPGIPSISSLPAQRGRPLLPMRERSSSVSEVPQLLASRQRSLDAPPAGPAGAHRMQPPPQGTPLDVVRLAHAAADRVLQRRIAEQSKPAEGPAEVEGRLGSAGSCDTLPAGHLGQQLGSLRQRSGSFGQGPTATGGRSSAVRDLDAATVASQLDQERQLAALMMIQDCAAAGAASLLSSAGAQGSSNLIYILKSLQEQSRSNPGALLAQLKAAQESPRQQMALMRMLRESLHLPAEAAPRQPSPDQPPARESPHDDGPGEAARKRGRPAKPVADDQWQPAGSRREFRRPVIAATLPAEGSVPLRMSHEEALQRLEAQADLRAKAGRAITTCNTERMSRIGSDPGAAECQLSGSRMKAFSSEGSPRSRAPNAPRTDSPSEALSGPSLIFNDSATSDDRLKRLNPFIGRSAEQHAPDSGRRPGWRAKGSGVPSSAAETARPAPHRGPGRPAKRPASPPQPAPKLESPVQPLALAGPAKEGLEREAAETLLFLNGTDPEDPPGATAAASESPKSRPKAKDGAATDVSPLQALVQDIMQQQKQRAQVNALASLPKSVVRAEVRGGYGTATVPQRQPEVAPPPVQPVKRKPGRPPKKKPEELAAMVQVAPPQPMLHQQSSASRFSVLGFAVPSGRRTGGKSGRPNTQQTHSGYSGGRSGRHRSSGSSGNLSEREAPGARSGAYLGVPLTRPRRMHRPADYDSDPSSAAVEYSGDGAEFSGGSSDGRSTDSESWNTKEYRRAPDAAPDWGLLLVKAPA
ncbi:hypothetical protein COCSUDRAFT_59552 [Coccomyxa subellipsoidea C-169]|uniref:Uncharacterized protein n=1 Tax=Coccomyxa subellipsoidea (strain C-169) TaxID=574566 RepID=I0YKZ7_COCSC|nr:hypothetical protein COCSUDRAFT_59552 [Coccomyxa subellipsoidea C-169]EIE19066.1 hypothetical protein COCSUDRAFT_59552 [Coccomyxa subellipsoidea C-169]|eukprot:XP_005643610.1 hypothetical protein COCSUDRAFT_59552 [Coccomyxa subellipsoidea C-169]